MDRMARSRMHGDISIKPTQLGLGLGYGLMRENYIRIVEKAKMSGIFVWLDMEEPRHVNATIRMYLEVGRHVRGGICIQSYLKRSLEDVKSITRKGGIVRLVKGAYAYREGSGMIKGRSGIDANYLDDNGLPVRPFSALRDSDPRHGDRQRGFETQQEEEKKCDLRDAEWDKQQRGEGACCQRGEGVALPAVRHKVGRLLLQEVEGDRAH